MDKYFSEFERRGLFSVDPLLLPVFIGLCPKNDLSPLIDNVPVFMSTTWLSVLASKITRLNLREVSLTLLNIELYLALNLIGCNLDWTSEKDSCQSFRAQRLVGSICFTISTFLSIGKITFTAPKRHCLTWMPHCCCSRS